MKTTESPFEPTRILICGSRNLDGPWVKQAIKYRLSLLSPGTEILHGMARSIDMHAHNIAKEPGLPIYWQKPDWTLGKASGIIRTNQLLDRQPSLVIAWWDGKSKGTEHTINEAQRRCIPVEIHRLGR